MPLDVHSWWILAAGLAMVAVALAWRALARRRRLDRLTRGLWFGGPVERIKCAEGVLARGLAPASRLLINRMGVELDPAVRLAVALAVAQRQWEPGPSESALALRRWAADELRAQGHDIRTFGPAFARASDMGGPRSAPPPGGGVTVPEAGR